MATEAALIARLEVKLTTLERQLKKAGAMAEGAVLDIEKKFAKANPKLGVAAGFGTFLGSLAGGATQIAIRGLQEMANEMRALGDASQFTGLALKEIYAIQQAIGGNAAQVNVALESITRLLDRAQRGEKNALSEIFRVNKVDLASIKDASGAMTVLADIMSRLTAAQARDLGKELGMTPEVVSRIREAGSAYTELKDAAAAAAPDLEELVRLGKAFDDAWQRATDRTKAFVLGLGSWKKILADFIADTVMILRGLEAVGAAVRGIVGVSGQGIAGQAADALAAGQAEEGGGPLVVNVGGKRAAAPLPTKGGGGSRGGGIKTDDVERYLEQLQKQNDLLTAEQAALGLSNEARAKAVALAKLHAEAREAGRAPTQAEIDSTLQLAAANERLSESIDKTQEAYALVNAEAKTFLSSLVGDLREGVDAAEALGNALQGIADRLMDRALDSLIDTLLPSKGGGPLAALFKGLPGYASGGLVPGSGPVPIMAHGGEIVVPKAQARSMGGSVVNFAPVIDARGADAGQIAVLRTEMRALIQTATPKIAAAVVRDRGRAW